jgi:hypothetical protein
MCTDVVKRCVRKTRQYMMDCTRNNKCSSHHGGCQLARFLRKAADCNITVSEYGSPCCCTVSWSHNCAVTACLTVQTLFERAKSGGVVHNIGSSKILPPQHARGLGVPPQRFSLHFDTCRAPPPPLLNCWCTLSAQSDLEANTIWKSKH